MLVNPAAVDPALSSNLLGTLCSIGFSEKENEMKEAIENLDKLEKWDFPMPKALLSGKLILRGAKAFHSCE